MLEKTSSYYHLIWVEYSGKELGDYALAREKKCYGVTMKCLPSLMC